MKFSLHNLSRTILLTSTLSLVLISCEKQEILNEEQLSNVSKNSSYIVEDGILKFDSWTSFLNVKTFVINMNDQERCLWEENLGFLSQRRIFKNIINAENEWDKTLASQYKNIKEIEDAGLKLHSNLYYNYLRKGIIKEFEKGTDDEYWYFSARDEGFVEFINENGIFAVGDTIFYINDSFVKALTNGNLNDIDKLIMAKSTSENDAIIIFKDPTTEKKGTSPGLIASPWTASSNKRIKVSAFLDVLYYVPAAHHYDFYHEVYVQCQERNWLGVWKYKPTEIWLDGDWVISVFWYEQFYGNNYSTHQYGVEYLKASINPQTGQPVPYRSYFGVNASNPYWMDEYCEPVFETLYWTALRYGGSSGLRATIDIN